MTYYEEDNEYLLANSLYYRIQQKYQPYMHQLNLYSQRIKTQGIEIIISPEKWDWPTRLTRLQLSDNGLGDGDVCLLMGRDWPCLEILGLQQNNLTNRAIRYLMKGKLPNLQCLYLSSNRITGEGMKALSKCKWPKLIFLEIEYLKIKSTDFETLFLSQYFSNIKQLRIQGNKIDVYGLLAFAASGVKKVFVSAGYNRVSAKQIETVKRLFTDKADFIDN